MKVKELIKLLKEMPQDLEVYGYCDHGQSPEKVSAPSVGWAGSIDHALYDEWSSTGKEEAEDSGYDKQFVLL